MCPQLALLLTDAERQLVVKMFTTVEECTPSNCWLQAWRLGFITLDQLGAGL